MEGRVNVSRHKQTKLIGAHNKKAVSKYPENELCY